MDVVLSQTILNGGLAFLAIATGIAVIVIAIFLVKLLKDLSTLAQNANETSILLNTELKPTLKELNEAIHSINSIAQNTDEGVGSVKLGLENAISKTKVFSESIFGGFLKGFMTVYSFFSKRKK